MFRDDTTSNGGLRSFAEWVAPKPGLIGRVDESSSDEELARSTAGGSGAHFSLLVKRYSLPLYRLAYRITGNVDDAEEAVQDTFLKVFKVLPQSRSDLPFKPWIYKIAMNTALSVLRKRKKTVLSEIPGDELAPLEADHSSEVAGRMNLQQALESLPLNFRQVVVLRAVEDLSYRDIAQILDSEEATVRSWFHRAKKIMENKIAR